MLKSKTLLIKRQRSLYEIANDTFNKGPFSIPYPIVIGSWITDHNPFGSMERGIIRLAIDILHSSISPSLTKLWMFIHTFFERFMFLVNLILVAEIRQYTTKGSSPFQIDVILCLLACGIIIYVCID